MSDADGAEAEPTLRRSRPETECAGELEPEHVAAGGLGRPGGGVAVSDETEEACLVAAFAELAGPRQGRLGDLSRLGRTTYLEIGFGLPCLAAPSC